MPKDFVNNPGTSGSHAGATASAHTASPAASSSHSSPSSDPQADERAQAAWFERGERALLTVPEAPDLLRAIIRQARRNPKLNIFADIGEMLTWRSFMIRTTAISLMIKKLCAGQDRVGVMLPASTAACMTWLAVQFSGKTPVMINWTAGPKNIGYAVKLSGIRTVISSEKLLGLLDGRGFDRSCIGDASWVLLEQAAKKIPIHMKLEALARATLALTGVEGAVLPPRISEYAAILFTSGSETMPKGVPLTHDNILANCRDVTHVLELSNTDSLLGCLPPFHSLGLTINIVLPLTFGIPTVCHPNPLEAQTLNRLCRRYGVTILVAPPTFIAGQLRKAQPGDLASVRLGFCGAESCPDKVYDGFEKHTSGVLCEGYGVTECSPVVAVNRPASTRRRTVGPPMYSVKTAIVTVEEPYRRVPDGENGLLLVRGPSIFGGYLSSPEFTPKTPFVTFEGERWYRTGDLVSVDGDGRLVFAGRLGRFVKIGGEMISLPQMEKLLNDYQSRRDGLGEDTIGDTEDGTLMGPALALAARETGVKQPEIVLFVSVPFTREEANRVLREAGLAAIASVREVVSLDSLPLLGTGKIDYRELSARLGNRVSNC